MDEDLQISRNEAEANLEAEARLRKPWQEGDLPIAKFMGKPIQELPQDLYIPPEVLEIFLETFEGPLDLLLYLIKRNNMDILDIQVSRIMQQYMQYIVYHAARLNGPEGSWRKTAPSGRDGPTVHVSGSQGD